MNEQTFCKVKCGSWCGSDVVRESTAIGSLCTAAPSTDKRGGASVRVCADRFRSLDTVVLAIPTVTSLLSEFMQQDGKTFACDKRDRTITCVFSRDLHLTLIFAGRLQKKLFKERWSLWRKRNFCHACHTKFVVFFPLPSCCVLLMCHWFFETKELSGI